MTLQLRTIRFVITVTVISMLFVFFSGCTGTSRVQPDLRSGIEISGSGEKDLPPMYNYPPDNAFLTDDNIPGIYHPGDILQTSPDSPLYDPDLAVIVVQDSGRGDYEVGGLTRSGGGWFRISGSGMGYVDHISIERSFPVLVGHGDYTSFPVAKGPDSFWMG